MNKDSAFSAVVRELDKHGIDFTPHRGAKHVKVCFEIDGQPKQVVVSDTKESDHRNIHNSVSIVRRMIKPFVQEVRMPIQTSEAWARVSVMINQGRYYRMRIAFPRFVLQRIFGADYEESADPLQVNMFLNENGLVEVKRDSAGTYKLQRLPKVSNRPESVTHTLSFSVDQIPFMVKSKMPQYRCGISYHGNGFVVKLLPMFLKQGRAEPGPSIPKPANSTSDADVKEAADLLNEYLKDRPDLVVRSVGNGRVVQILKVV